MIFVNIGFCMNCMLCWCSSLYCVLLMMLLKISGICMCCV